MAAFDVDAYFPYNGNFSMTKSLIRIGCAFNRIGDALRRRVLTILTCLTLNGYKLIYDSRMVFIYL